MAFENQTINDNWKMVSGTGSLCIKAVIIIRRIATQRSNTLKYLNKIK